MPTITMTNRQARLVEMCLEAMCRGTLGQPKETFATLLELRKVMLRKFPCPDGEKRSYLQLCGYLEEWLKPILFPELVHNESYGVGQTEIGDGQTLYEMVKVLQNYRAKKQSHSPSSVLHHPPLHYSKDPLIKVEESPEDKHEE